MAFYEQKASKGALDDTAFLTCTIETAHNLKAHTEYVIRVQRGPVPERGWTICKRYSEFSHLDSELRISGLELPLPPKKVIGKMEREFIAERQQGLQNFLNAVLSHQMLTCSKAVKIFLDPTNYAVNLQETALQHISMFFRSESRWTVIEPAPDIGWRFRKKYFLIKDKHQPKEKFLLSWTTFGPDRLLSDKDSDISLKLLATFQHPFLCPVIFATSNDTCGIAIRRFYDHGTLRDQICKSKPRERFLKKYASLKCNKSLQLCNIQRYGRQLLETLKYLHNKGYYYGHLHAGNIIIDEQNRCRLLDLENSLMGLPSYYRPYITQYRKIQSLENVDVYCFGQLLFEMSFGEALNAPVCDKYPPNCPPELRSVLESILTTEACRNGLPSIDDLLQHQLFESVVLPPPVDKIQVKIPSKLKQPLQDTFEATKKRLKEDQKMIHHYQRLSKAQAYHMSDEEKKKRRRSKRKQLLEQQQSVEVTVVNGNSHNVSSNSNDATSDGHVISDDVGDTNSHVNGVVTNSDSSSQDTEVSDHTNPAVPCKPPMLCSGNQGNVNHGNSSRGALLSSISGFNKASLKRANNDN